MVSEPRLSVDDDGDSSRLLPLVVAIIGKEDRLASILLLLFAIDLLNVDALIT